MEDIQYGIATDNRFALLDNDEDPIEALLRASQVPKEENQTKKDKKKAQKAAAKTALEQSQKPEGYQPQQNGRGGGGRGGRGSRVNGEYRPPRMQGSDGASATSNDTKNGNMKISAEMRDRKNYNMYKKEHGEGQSGFDRGARGYRGNGRGRGRGGRGRGGSRPASVAGEKHEGASGEKQPELDGQNGTDKTGDMNEDNNPADAATEQQENGHNKLNDESGKAALAAKEEEPKEMTLDEWKALQDQKRVKSTFNIRKAGEGVDSKQWKKGVAYKKKQAEDESEEEEEQEQESHRGQRKNMVTDVKITFSDEGRFGGRGGFRGRGGGRRGGFNRQESNKTGEVQPPCIEDETAFPSLGKSKK